MNHSVQKRCLTKKTEKWGRFKAMKKIAGLLLVLVLIFTGCSPREESQQSERKTKVKSEMENEQVQSDGSKAVEDSSKTNETLLLKGKLIVTGTELGHGILLDEESIIG
ncbi:hypothetical protein [Peptoclostridium litorale]|nr:hypothetical protein [Peptoclostridium litorale]